MNAYTEIYNALSKLCRNENLQFMVIELKDEKIEFMRIKDVIILNKNYHEYKFLSEVSS